jgi:hypothetical protein
LFTGYYAECRQRIGGDAGPPGLAAELGRDATAVGIVSEGLLITSVHEEALATGLHPVHVVRPGAAPIDQAALQPGQEFTAFPLKLHIRFDGYEPLAGGEPGCRVTVTYSPGPWTIVDIGSRPSVSSWPRDTIAVSPDIAAVPVTRPLPWPRVVPPGPIPIAAPWWGHSNRVAVHLHNWGTEPVRNVDVAVAVNDRVTVAAPCQAGTPPRAPLVRLSRIAAGGDATAWVAAPPLHGLDAQIAIRLHPARRQMAAVAETARNAFAFQYHRANDRHRNAIRSKLWLSAPAGCREPQSFSVAAAAVPRGWQVSISAPHVVVAPGERKAVDVAVLPPPSARWGTQAQIPIDVLQLGKLDGEPGQFPRAPDRATHYKVVGGLSILASIVLPAHIRVSCTRRGGVILGQVVPRNASGDIVFEVRAPSGTISFRRVRIRSDGRFAVPLIVTAPGRWRIQAWWRGDARHAPAESMPCTVGRQ